MNDVLALMIPVAIIIIILLIIAANVKVVPQSKATVV